MCSADEEASEGVYEVVQRGEWPWAGDSFQLGRTQHNERQGRMHGEGRGPGDALALLFHLESVGRPVPERLAIEHRRKRAASLPPSLLQRVVGEIFE